MIAVYTGAKPVVVDTRDVEVVRNILNDLPMSHAFDPGQTQLFSGLEEAIGICRPWAKDEYALVILSDGDTLPAIGMPACHRRSLMCWWWEWETLARALSSMAINPNRKAAHSDKWPQDWGASITMAMRATFNRIVERMMNAGKGGSSNLTTLREFALMAASIGSLLLARHPLSSCLGRHALSARRAGQGLMKGWGKLEGDRAESDKPGRASPDLQTA